MPKFGPSWRLPDADIPLLADAVEARSAKAPLVVVCHPQASVLIAGDQGISLPVFLVFSGGLMKIGRKP